MRPWLFLLAAATTGCLGVPFATPPARASISWVGLSKPLPKGESSAAHFDIGVYPAGLLPDQRARRIEMGIGYGSLANGKNHVHAPYLDIQALPLVRTLGKTAVIRGGTAFKPALLYGPAGSTGFGGTAQILFELSDHVEGTFGTSDKDGGVVGAGGGELGIGLHLEGLAMRLNETNYWGGGFGIDVRLPASIGFLWVWLPSLLKK